MESLKLPITESPICGLQYLAYPLVISLKYDNYPWFFNNYIQLEAPKEAFLDSWGCNVTFSGGWFQNVPCIEYQIIKRVDFLNNSQGIVSQINNFLAKDWYIYSIFDEFFVPDRISYRSKHNLHDFLLFGTDLTEEYYTILGYGKNSILDESTISFRGFVDAFESQFNDSINDVNIYRINKTYKSEFNLKQVYELLCEYLKSQSSSHLYKYNVPFNDSKIYGFEVYDFVIRYFQSLAQDAENSDIRPLCILYEHKSCMVMRLEYMLKNSHINISQDLLDMFIEIKAEMLKIRNMQIAINFVKGLYKYETIIFALEKIKNIERIAIEYLLNEIHTTLNK